MTTSGYGTQTTNAPFQNQNQGNRSNPSVMMIVPGLPPVWIAPRHADDGCAPCAAPSVGIVNASHNGGVESAPKLPESSPERWPEMYDVHAASNRGATDMTPR